VADPDILAFANAIGAQEPLQGSKYYADFRREFKRHNYFMLEKRFLIVKISRTKRPFWGVGKKFLEFLDGLNEYWLVLLISPTEGWAFSKTQVSANIRSQKWKLGGSSEDYKINPPLPHRNAFSSPQRFLALLGPAET
jgi:hypothetical protein